MIRVTLSFDPDMFSHMTGQEAARFFRGYLADHPQDLIDKADEVTIAGPWGHFSEVRE